MTALSAIAQPASPRAEPRRIHVRSCDVCLDGFGHADRLRFALAVGNHALPIASLDQLRLLRRVIDQAVNAAERGRTLTLVETAVGPSR